MSTARFSLFARVPRLASLRLSSLVGTFAMGVLLATLGQTGCASSSDRCRLDPASCNGAAGTLCNTDNDCNGGLFCCDDDNNCGGGMCTFECDSDNDCPLDMLCEHDVCFYACDSDDDCAPTQSCEHGNTVCEY